MPEDLIVFPLVPDLPEDWVIDSIITPNGTEVGLTERYGYNYLMKMVNKSLKAVNQVDARITTSIANLEAIPKGIVAMWAGELINIPTGWKLCDGLEGRPNMLARFIRGIQTSATNPGTTGGADTLTLSAANLPSHNHSIGTHTHSETSHSHAIAHSHTISGTIGSVGEHAHNYLSRFDNSLISMGGYKNSDGGYPTIGGIPSATYSQYNVWIGSSYSGMHSSLNTAYAASHTHSFGGSANSYNGNTGTASGGNTGANAASDTGDTGTGQSFDIKPAYYEIAFIIKV